MTPILFYLLNHLWQSTLVAALAWLVCITLLRNNSPRIRFAVWLATSLKFLVPFALLMQIGASLGLRRVFPAQSRDMIDYVARATPTLAASPFRITEAPQVVHIESLWPALLLTTWALGAAFVFLRWALHYWSIRTMARAAQPSASLGTDFRGVPLRISRTMRERQLEPGVFGLWRQTILLPEGITEHLTPTQLEAVLTHEWHHAQRRDNLAARLQLLAEIVFWFYPIVWFIGRKLTDEREMACDQAVLESAPAGDYAEGILNICKFYTNSSHGFVAGITSADLRSRIAAILKGEPPMPLNRARRWTLTASLAALLAGPLTVGLLTAQNPADQLGNSFQGLATTANLKFEVATVKLSPPDADSRRLGPPGGGNITILNYPLRALLIQVFRGSRFTVIVPDSIPSGSYDIVAKGPDPKLTNPQVWEMMRSLMMDRFHMKFHTGQREMDVFALTVAKGGSKLIPGEKGHCAEQIKKGELCGDIIVPPFGTGMYNMPIGALITGIGQRAGRPIIDKTGLTGRYDVNVNWVPDGANFNELNLTNVPKELRPEDMTVFEALEKQGGLKLEKEKALMPVVIVDSITEPEPN